MSETIVNVILPPGEEPRPVRGGGRSLLCLLRPVLVCSSLCGSLPISVSDYRWRFVSFSTVRNALLDVLVLSLLMVQFTVQPPQFSSITSAMSVYYIFLSLVVLVRWMGTVLWAWLSVQRLSSMFAACLDYERAFGVEPLLHTARYVRLFVAYQVLSFVYIIAVNTAAQVENSSVWWLVVINTITSLAACGGFVFWIILFACLCRGLTEMFSRVTERLQEAVERQDVQQMRKLVHQHSRISDLAGELCRTFGGFVAVSMYLLIVEVSLSVYFGVRPGKQLGEAGSLTLRVMMRMLTPSSLILLKVMTNTGEACRRESRRAAGILKDQLKCRLAKDLPGEGSAVREELWELHRQLQEQEVDMDMAGYFTLDRQFFVQSIKDFLTLIVAAVQFDMPFLLKE
ncbi:hypothetical protein FJT64_004755 [Amphibalanus amphitrite]|uniref:Uncharacterized protein n=1 Tax=Amphibalanus amphitrite TaxID=1232801 RepID=A0A6A4VW62_AMPAM|nr:hypothetical protein FJT64_004755 [Amphibalanus amphitrite]